jgi:SpoVK/Ycf46/Vps4 family AAA+-type ATPase
VSQGHFKVIKMTNLSECKEGDTFPQSDFATMTESGQFCQMEYVETDTYIEPIIAKPGVYTMIKTMAGLKLEKTEFQQNNVLKEFVNTKPILEKCNNFFSRLSVYEKYKVFPKRGILLYGPPGTGKTSAISELCNSIKDNEEYFVLVWHTDQIEAGQVKDFVKHLDYQGPTKMILIVEDIGGIESENRRGSESSLLALLDNQEKAFKIPVLILATTNYIENFQGNLTNRPGRFDEKLKIGFPPAEAREKLLKHYDIDGIITEEAMSIIKSKDCEKFTPAQLQELIIRSALNDIDPVDVIKEMVTEIKKFDKNFQDPTKGFGLNRD